MVREGQSQIYRSSKRRAKSIAVVSGKGGSGKTIFAAALAMILDEHSEYPVTLVDADIGTGGLSYFLGLNYVQGINDGLTESIGILEVASKEDVQISPSHLMANRLRKISALEKTKLVPVGDFQQFFNENDNRFANYIKMAIDSIDEITSGFVIVDCRGGIDSAAVAVCSSVDEIIIVTETDAASIQATQNLVNLISSRGLLSRIVGFVINKAFDEPSQIAQAGTSLYRSSYLGPIPFDLSTIRNFIKGDLPAKESVFVRHVEMIVRKLDWSTKLLSKDFMLWTADRPWTQQEYSRWGRTDERVMRGERLSLMFYFFLLSASFGLYFINPLLLFSSFYDVQTDDPYMTMNNVKGLAQAVLVGIILMSMYGILTNSDRIRRYLGRLAEIVFRHRY